MMFQPLFDFIEKLATDFSWKRLVLFWGSSISLLSQTLREWTTESVIPLRNFAVCSDAKVGRNDEDIHAYDLAIPATTNPEILANKLKTPFEKGAERLNVVFSTYHSLDVVAQAQEREAPEFLCRILKYIT